MTRVGGAGTGCMVGPAVFLASGASAYALTCWWTRGRGPLRGRVHTSNFPHARAACYCLPAVLVVEDVQHLVTEFI